MLFTKNHFEMIQKLFMSEGTASENTKTSIVCPSGVLWEGAMKNLMEAADRNNLKMPVGGKWPNGWILVEIARKEKVGEFGEVLPKYNGDIMISII